MAKVKTAFEMAQQENEALKKRIKKEKGASLSTETPSSSQQLKKSLTNDQNHKIMKNLAKAVIQVMKEVKSIDKGLSVGAGSNSYKGVADKDVKQVIGQAMQKAGLCMLPLEIDPTTRPENT